jgi:hypothetical protein
MTPARERSDNSIVPCGTAGHFSPDRDVVPRGVFRGPAFRVALVFAPRAPAAACFPRPAPRFGPPFTSFRPGFAATASRRGPGCVPVLSGPLPRSPPWFLIDDLRPEFTSGSMSEARGAMADGRAPSLTCGRARGRGCRRSRPD